MYNGGSNPVLTNVTFSGNQVNYLGSDWMLGLGGGGCTTVAATRC